MERLHVPGVAVGVFADGEEHVAAFGVTSVDNPLPVNEDTLFESAPPRRPCTATVAMRLVEQGKLDLDTPVRKYVPGAQAPGRRGCRARHPARPLHPPRRLGRRPLPRHRRR